MTDIEERIQQIAQVLAQLDDTQVPRNIRTSAKAAVEKAGSFDVDKVRQAVYGLEFDAPGGKKSMHPNNQHTLKPVYIGEILKDGQFKIVYQSEGLVSPDSYSSYLHPDGNVPAPTGGPKKK